MWQQPPVGGRRSQQESADAKLARDLQAQEKLKARHSGGGSGGHFGAGSSPDGRGQQAPGRAPVVMGLGSPGAGRSGGAGHAGHQLNARNAGQRSASPVNERAVGEQTRRRKVQENMQMAMEVNPEDFTKIPMLFIACRVNGHRIVALVDTGAQCSVMGRRAADACGITQLLDTRFKGVAKGVGTAGIVGKVHLTEVVVGHQTFAMSITVMADQTQIDFILGLDVIRKYQCVIDMTQNCMIIGGEKVAFSQSGGR